jgi:hypothetical protein
MPVAIFVVSLKTDLGWSMQPAARSNFAMQQEALAVHLIFKYFHATEQHFAFCPKCRYAVRSVAYIFRGDCFDHNLLMKLVFGSVR